MEVCRDKKINNEKITDVNVKTLPYIKSCKKQTTPRNVTLAQQYLKEKNLLAIAFDKAIRICLMYYD